MGCAKECTTAVHAPACPHRAMDDATVLVPIPVAQAAADERSALRARVRELEETIEHYESLSAPSANGREEAISLMHAIQSCDEDEGADGLCGCARMIAARFDDYVKAQERVVAALRKCNSVLVDVRIDAANWLRSHGHADIVHRMTGAIETADAAILNAAAVQRSA